MSDINASDIKIIIVDDSDFSRSVISKMLVEEGFQIMGEAASAEAALPLIKEKKPDLVIVDIVMPNVSGLELTEKISQDVAVIVISSLSQEHVVLDAISAGASDFIAKPIQKQQLIDSVQKIMSEKGKE